MILLFISLLFIMILPISFLRHRAIKRYIIQMGIPMPKNNSFILFSGNSFKSVMRPRIFTAWLRKHPGEKPKDEKLRFIINIYFLMLIFISLIILISGILYKLSF